MSILDLPSCKLYVKDFSHCQRSAQAVNPIVKSVNWEVSVFGKKKQFGCVWIQGVVVETAVDEIAVDDGTGVARVVGCDKVPSSCPKVKKGQYVLVIGVLTGSGTLPVIRAIKIQDLSSCSVAETMWMLEVIDAAEV